jgi:hypothetical protein
VPLKTVYLSDVVPIYVGVYNMRSDDIYDVKVYVNCSGNVLQKEKDVAVLSPNSGKTFVVMFSPPSNLSRDTINVTVSYSDDVGNRYSISKSVDVSIIPKYTVTVTNVEYKKDKIKGDVGNRGFSKVYGVTVCINAGDTRKEYFIGSIAPSDVQEFEVDFPKKDNITIEVVWTNEFGEEFKITKSLRLQQSNQLGSADMAFYAIVSIIVGICLRRRK